MLEIHERLASPEAAEARLTLPCDARLTLPFDARQKSRLRAVLDAGREAAIFLPRGTLLRGDDVVRSTEGEAILIVAADQDVSTVRCADPRALMRAAYHLGNRHVPVQIGPGWLRDAHDHVLDELVRPLGLEVGAERAPFEPEGGAYGEHGAAHAHAPHDHGHAPHEHGHAPHEHGHAPHEHGHDAHAHHRPR